MELKDYGKIDFLTKMILQANRSRIGFKLIFLELKDYGKIDFLTKMILTSEPIEGSVKIRLDDSDFGLLSRTNTEIYITRIRNYSS